MNQKLLKYIIFFVLFISCAGGIIYFSRSNAAEPETDESTAAEPVKPVELPKVSLTVEDGEVWSTLCERSGLDAKVCYSIYDSTKEVYDLAKIRVGKVFDFYGELDQEHGINSNYVDPIDGLLDGDTKMKLLQEKELEAYKKQISQGKIGGINKKTTKRGNA
jgi:hypothetical protein